MFKSFKKYGRLMHKECVDKPNGPRIIHKSNIIQYDVLGSPMLLCIIEKENGLFEQAWVDVPTEWANEGISDHTLFEVVWSD